MQRFTTLADVIEQAITPALGEHGEDYDLEAIAREAFTYQVDTDADGNELLDTAGFEQIVDEAGFWAIVAKYDTTGQDDDQPEGDAEDDNPHAWLTLDAGCLIHGDNAEVGILTHTANMRELLAPVALPVGLSDHEKTQDAAETALKAAGWETDGEWDAVDTGYTISVRRIPTGD